MGYLDYRTDIDVVGSTQRPTTLANIYANNDTLRQRMANTLSSRDMA